MSCITICPNCGKNTPEGKFCEHCGASLSIVPSYVPPQPLQPQQPGQPEPEKKNWGTTVTIVCCILLLILMVIGYLSSLSGY